MRRRTFLRAVSGTVAAGVPVLFDPDAIRRLQAATRRTATLTPEEVAEDESFWREVQQSFAVSRHITYLNTSSASSSPRVVLDAVVHQIWEQEKAPSNSLYTNLAVQVEPVRASLAKMFGCEAEEIAITRNATDALDTVLLGLPLNRGDEVLTTTQDYWAMLDALEQRRQREGIVVKKITIPTPPRGMDDLVQAFVQGMSPATKLILLSNPVNLTGQFLPVKQICDIAHTRGIEVIVDGAQAVGHVALKQADLGCDYFGASLHKWVMAPKGTGMLYVKRDKIAKVWPLFPAPSSRKTDDIRKFEALGLQSTVMLAIADALTFGNGVGAERTEARLCFLTRRWVERLGELPNVRFHTSFSPGMSCGIATVDVAKIDSYALTDYLWKRHQIVVFNVARRTSEFQGIRISPHLHTTLDELDRFCDVIEHVAKNGLSNGA
ncbi:MAG: aminotransferase class V-fold PLP-dependent enzyme [Acidobacteria bacterium]|nr:aminotransferase class V-fold PLP-dependent enzyme [Acidobacteriota bacterium]